MRTPIIFFAKMSRWIWLLSLAVLFSVFFAVIFHARPLVDDICREVAFRDEGLFPYLRSLYFGWSGRWSGVGLSVGVGSFKDPFTIYPFFLALHPGIGFFSFYSILRALAPEDRPRGLRAGCAASLTALHLARTPGPEESLFWLTGVAENQWSVALGFVLLAAMVHLATAPPKKAAWLAAFCLPLAVFVSGLHELFNLAIVPILSVGVWLAYRAKAPSRGALAVVWSVFVGGFLFSALAPGNFHRLGVDYHHRGDWIGAMALAWRQALDVLPAWILDPSLAALTVGLAILAHGQPVPADGSGERLARRWMFPTSVAAVAGLFVSAGWIMGQTMPPRTSGGIHLFFLSAWASLVLFYGRREPWRKIWNHRYRDAGLLVAGLFFSCSVWREPNAELARYSLRHEIPHFVRERENRFRYLAQSAATGVKAVRLDPIVPWPRVYVGDLSPDPSHFNNRCVASYYKLDSIALKAERKD